MKTFLTLLILLFAASAWAIPPSPPVSLVGVESKVATATVATLPAAGTAGTLRQVTDGADATDCTVGGGATIVLCQDTGAAWAVVAAAGSGDLKADGTVPLSADWDVGAFEVRAETFESDVATGTAPLVVASTTKVTNLNADAIDDTSPGAMGLTILATADEATFKSAVNLEAGTDFYGSTDNAVHATLNLTGANTLGLGTGESATGKIRWKNATNTNIFDLQSGVATESFTWTFPTAAAGGDNYLVNVDADGTMDYTDPSTLGGAAEVADEVFSAANFDGDTTTGVSQDDFYDRFNLFDADDDGDFTDEAWFPSATGAPTDATYLTTTAEAGLSAEANLGALTTGLVKITVDAGVATPSTAEAGTDYAAASSDITSIGDCASGACTADAVLDDEDISPTGGTWDLSALTLTLPPLNSELKLAAGGLEFTETDTLTDCSTFAATGGGIFYDDSEGIFKKCQDNVLTDLDTSGAETNDLETDGAAGIADTEIFIGTGAGTGNYAAISGDAALASTGALTIADDVLEVGNMANGDWGDFSISSNVATLDADVVGTNEMADADHGQVAWSGGAATVQGIAVRTASKSAAYTIGTDDADEAYGGVIYVTDAATITAPAVAAGMSFTVITIGAVAVSLDVNASDRMYLDGVALADGDKATNTSTTGDLIHCTYESAAGWYCASGSTTGNQWTDGGP